MPSGSDYSTRDHEYAARSGSGSQYGGDYPPNTHGRYIPAQTYSHHGQPHGQHHHQQQQIQTAGRQHIVTTTRTTQQHRIPSFSGAAPFRRNPYADSGLALRELKGIGMPPSIAIGGMSLQPQSPWNMRQGIAQPPFGMPHGYSMPQLQQNAAQETALMEENNYLKMRVEFLDRSNKELQEQLTDVKVQLRMLQEAAALQAPLSFGPNAAEMQNMNPIACAAAAGAAAAATEALKGLSRPGGFALPQIAEEGHARQTQTPLPEEDCLDDALSRLRGRTGQRQREDVDLPPIVPDRPPPPSYNDTPTKAPPRNRGKSTPKSVAKPSSSRKPNNRRQNQ